MPPLKTNDLAAVEQAAYEMIDKTFCTIPANPEFQKIRLSRMEESNSTSERIARRKGGGLTSVYTKPHSMS